MTNLLSINENETKLDQALKIIILLYQAVVVVAFIFAIILAIRWWKTPFIGGFVEHTMVFNGVGPKRSDADQNAWGLFNQGFSLDKQLIAIEDTPVRSAGEMEKVLRQYQVGDTVEITYRTDSGEQSSVNIQLIAFPLADKIKYFVVPYSAGFIYLFLGVWMARLRLSESVGRAFVLLATSFAYSAAGIFDIYSTNVLTILWTFSVAIAGGALLDLALNFPQRFAYLDKKPYISRIGYGIALALGLLALPSIYNTQAPFLYIQRWQFIYGFAGFSFFFFIGAMLTRLFISQSPVAKQQIKMVWWGIALAFSPIGIWLFISFFHTLNFSPYLLVPTIGFPIVTGYAILRYRMFKVDYVFSRSMLILTLTLVASISYGLILWGLGLISGNMISPNNPWAMGGFVAVVALLLHPVYLRLQSAIDSIAFRGKQNFEDAIGDFGQRITAAQNLVEVANVLRTAIAENLLPEMLHIYIHDFSSNQYVAMPYQGKPTSDMRFTTNSPLLQKVEEERSAFYLDLANLPRELKEEESRLKLLNASLFVPLKSIDKPMGWIALGMRRSGDAYNSYELDFLENLSNQAGIAIERAQVVVNMKKQVEEMNALTRISQGVSITLSFNDVLELIYAQTIQIIPATDFHITLNNPTGDYFYYAFCIEDQQRLTEKENHPIPHNQGVAQWVARNSRALLSQDYLQECQRLNVVPSIQRIYAWAGVPLNAGSETIGTLGVGSRDPNTAFTDKQLDLLRAIADQTAGAIVKARLLDETERRARQLATLNEITQQLTSTLAHEPLLQNILESAVQILDCEAGSLFMVDEETDEFIFTVAVGPAAPNLIGKRLPLGEGIIGRALETRLPVVENNASQSKGWSNSTDEETGFSTQALLAVPLQIKERVIGVIEVINKKDGLPFVEDDQNLLTAFAGQAAVAVENARLYTLTDRELNDRVEELSIMQRIDRELNTSLEIDRAMRTTLEWAMRRSEAEAGLIGMLAEGGVEIVVNQGYADQLDYYDDKLLPLELPAMVNAVEGEQPVTIQLNPVEQGGLLSGTRTQIAIPLRREGNVVGIIFLESRKRVDADLEFLSRLSDHAAVAISNAQLYTELQAANVAKSDFVSFVAHELKNPMTSIKGYTELIAAGAVGEISEPQKNFLQTIRSNVMRMSTLVSDLNDNAKIEVNRLRMDFSAFDITESIKNSVRSLEKQMEEKQQTIVFAMPESLPKIWADKTRIEQILVNFISNAYKYTPEGGEIIIGAQDSENKWDPEGAPFVIHVWVKDNGIGMTEEDQAKIFTKFFRSEDQKARESPGTGLGLNITKSLVEMQGGQTWFESKFREGTTFHFTVPIADE